MVNAYVHANDKWQKALENAIGECRLQNQLTSRSPVS